MTEITDQHIEQFLAAAHKTGERGLTRCSSGNLSWRIGEYALISGTGSWLSELKKDQISICRIGSQEIVNGIKPSMESSFHLNILTQRPEVNVVLHCQSIYATTIACMKDKPDNFNVTIEIPCYCGRDIAIVPYYRPGSTELAQAVTAAMQTHDSALLEKHGQVYAGKNLSETIQKAEFLEMACQIIIQSRMNYNTLTSSEIDELTQYIGGKK